MKVLVVDVGGTHVKILASGHKESREFPSGPTLTARRMVAGVQKLARGWKYDMVAIGYPGSVLRGRPVLESHNLGKGWVGFDSEAAFKHDCGRHRGAHGVWATCLIRRGPTRIMWDAGIREAGEEEMAPARGRRGRALGHCPGARRRDSSGRQR